MWGATNDREVRLLMLSLSLLVIGGMPAFFRASLGSITE